MTKGYGDGISDKTQPGDTVLADCGFNVEDSIQCGIYKCNLVTLCFTTEKSQLDSEDVKATHKTTNISTHCLYTYQEQFRCMKTAFLVETGSETCNACHHNSCFCQYFSYHYIHPYQSSSTLPPSYSMLVVLQLRTQSQKCVTPSQKHDLLNFQKHDVLNFQKHDLLNFQAIGERVFLQRITSVIMKVPSVPVPK